MMSYPMNSGGRKVLQYPDVRMVAEAAEAEGIDFRIIYLQRPAKDMLIADTNHRHFDS